MRRPGVEPESKAWEASMLTFTPATLAKHNARTIWSAVFEAVAHYLEVSKFLIIFFDLTQRASPRVNS